jgi:hypothetical protein
MASWTNKISKVAQGELRPGESFVTAAFLQPAGSAGAMVSRSVGGIVGAAVVSKLRTKDDGSLVSDSGSAAMLPNTKLLVGLTDQRLLVYNFGGLMGKPKDLVAALDRSALAGVDVQDGKLTKRVTLVFTDGTGRVYEAPRLNSGIDEFVAAVGAA